MAVYVNKYIGVGENGYKCVESNGYPDPFTALEGVAEEFGRHFVNTWWEHLTAGLSDGSMAWYEDAKGIGMSTEMETEENSYGS